MGDTKSLYYIIFAHILNASQAGIINTSTKQLLDELEQKKDEIELEIIHEEKRRPILTREDVTYWICRSACWILSSRKSIGD